ncbi:energy transducer TonB [Rubellimicrobium aerolatum]|uniref:Energy transducer TonB n=1 Tax=Rubellimicrobium aerolatum TaxID=490979 RepID=A0ABW0SCE7_9RHOB|nr:energy transducer TonB [Rubellimicrobium aerolatum]MBP1806355.1 hypothetical protein [Rubellimicrobium aerolatum]
MHPFRPLALAALALPLLAASLSAQDASSAALPDVVAQLGLTEVEAHSHRGEGRHLQGRLPEGAWVEVDLHRDGRVEEVEAHDGDGFPIAAVAALVPEAVRASPSFPAEARLHKLDWDGDRIEIEGRDGEGREFEAEFATDGRLIEMDVED